MEARVVIVVGTGSGYNMVKDETKGCQLSGAWQCRGTDKNERLPSNVYDLVDICITINVYFWVIYDCCIYHHTESHLWVELGVSRSVLCCTLPVICIYDNHTDTPWSKCFHHYRITAFKVPPSLKSDSAPAKLLLLLISSFHFSFCGSHVDWHVSQLGTWLLG